MMINKSKLTLIIDGNWLLISRMSNMIGKFATEKDMMLETKLLMIKSINKVLRLFPKIDNIIFVADGGSWRASEKIPDCLNTDTKNELIPCATYKGTRMQDKNLDWEVIFGEYEKFLETLDYNGIQVCKEPGIEGDDWCWYWSTKLNDDNTNVIIWSKDKDLTQLVNKNSDGVFTVCWNDGGVTCKQTVDEDDLTSFLLNPYYAINEQLLHDIIQHSSAKIGIDPKAILVEKIFRGDKGDNIFPIIQRKSKSGSNKLFRISTKDMDFSLNVYDDNAVKNYIDNLLEQKNYKNRVLHSIEDIYEHFYFNRKLVSLNEKEYPQYVKDIFSKYKTYKFSKNIVETEQQIQAEKNAINELLDSI